MIQSINANIAMPYAWAIIFFIIFLSPKLVVAKETKFHGTRLNVIDHCWRRDPDWQSNRQRLAECSVGFAGKMANNMGSLEDLKYYEVTDPSDNAVDPKPGTLRYGATLIRGKVWITFLRDMIIELEKPLLISSFTTIDGRGARVHIAGNACLTIFEASDIIIHGLRIHHCKAQGPSKVMGPEGKLRSLGPVDGDAIRLVTVSKIWIDHNTFYKCDDGLLDVTLGSTDITISNNRFRHQDKVMLLGHDDGYSRDKDMKVTIIYNHFGPNCSQRMPRIRYGYSHVVNNLYLGWKHYAIGGSMNPTVVSEANLFIAPELENKEVTWRCDGIGSNAYKFYSVGDMFENGASFLQTGVHVAQPQYNQEQIFRASDATAVRSLTRSAGALRCTKTTRC